MQRALVAATVGLLVAGCSAAPTPAPAPVPGAPGAETPKAPSEGPEDPSATALLRATEVPFSFERDGQHLGGVLTLPQRAPGARLPGVILVHGSGPMSRDGFMPGQLGLGFGFEFPVYAELARELSGLGYVVIRYDKRTCLGAGICESVAGGAGAGLASFASPDTVVDDFAEDAKAAYRTVSSYPFIDAGRVVFVGHSQGAQLVPRLLTELPSVPAGVMLTPPYRDVPELLRRQGLLLIDVMRRAGKQDRIGEGYELLRASRQLAAVEAGRPAPRRILGQPVKLWLSWMRASQQAPQLALSLDRPLLVLGGTYDFNVAPDEMQLWSRWLMGSRHQVEVLPCVTHALNCISQVDPALIEPEDIGREIAAELVVRLGGFLRATLAARNDKKLTTQKPVRSRGAPAQDHTG